MQPLAFSHQELEQPRLFTSRDDLITWAEAELAFWAGFKTTGSRTADQHAREARHAFEKLLQAAHDDSSDESLAAALGTVSRDARVLSSGTKAMLIRSLGDLGYSDIAMAMAYAAFFARDEVAAMMRNDRYLFDGVVALSHVAAYEAGGDAQRLVEFLRVIHERQVEWVESLERTKAQTAANQLIHDSLVQEIRAIINISKSNVREAVVDFERTLGEIRIKFEEKFALRAPMTYWTEKAERHVVASTVYRWWFSGLLLGGVALLGTVGYFWLFPFLMNHPTAYWALILYSVAIAVLAWPLRITSKLYLVHRQLFEDAAEREVIARTFLALGDQVQLSDADRQLLLSALMRPASISLAGDESGLNIADIIAARTLMKS